MDFPHLSDTAFPLLNNVDVYSFKNEFDYTRWVPDTDIVLCNVLWDSSYKDVVKFKDNTARDFYFDNITDIYRVKLESDARVVPDGYIKLPIPYDVMARYNYLYIDLPIATSNNNMIDYENTTGVKRWYFFIDNIRYMAPNTTEVFLTLDVWNNFINDIKFKYAMLERGHAPVAATDVNDYLNNPIENCELLLAEDVNFGTADVVKNTKMVPVGNGEKYICFIITTDFSDFSFGQTIQSQNYTYNRPLSYRNASYRQGYQVIVDGYGIGDGYDYSSIKTPVHGGCNSTDDVVPNNVFCVAVKAKDCIGNNNFITYILENKPSFMNSVQCTFMASDDMIEIDGSSTLGNYVVYSVKKKRRSHGNIRLNKNMFDYEPEYERFAKLYTSPYAHIEISDDDGNTREVLIENVSNRAEVISDFSLAYPYLNARVFLIGIGYSGLDECSYAWRKLTDENYILNTPNSEWAKYMFEYDIPTYALFMDGQTAWNMTNFNRGAKAARLSALTAYHNGARDANTAYENAVADHMTAHKNAVNIAKTVRINADNIRDANKAIADGTNDAGMTNTRNNMAVSDVNNAIATTASATNVDQSLYVNIDNSVVSVNQAYGLLQDTNNASSFSTDVDVTKTGVIAANTSAYQMRSELVSGAIAGETTALGVALGAAGAAGTAGLVGGGPAGAAFAATAGLLIGGTVGVIKGSQSSAMTNANSSAYINASNAMYTVGLQLNNATGAWNRALSAHIQSNANALQLASAQNELDSRWLQHDNNLALTSVVAANAYEIANKSATINYNLASTNNNNLRNVSTTNADNTVNNANENSLYTRENAIMNLKETLENSQDIAQSAMNDAKNQRPISYGAYSGDISGDAYMNRGMRIRIKTQSKSAIKQTADYFARYGYALNQMWDIETSGLCMMKYFTYWKCYDVWVDDMLASNNLTQKTIASIMESGVTVWSDPDKIGKVGVYENE